MSEQHHFVIEIGAFMPHAYSHRPLAAFSDVRNDRAIGYKLHRENQRVLFYEHRRPKPVMNQENGRVLVNSVVKDNGDGATAVFDFSLPPLAPERDYLFVANDAKQSLVGHIVAPLNLEPPFKALHFTETRDPGPRNILTATLFERNPATHSDKYEPATYPQPFSTVSSTENQVKNGETTWTEMDKDELVLFSKNDPDAEWTTFDIYSMNNLAIDNPHKTTHSAPTGKEMRYVGSISFNPFTKEKNEDKLHQGNIKDMVTGLTKLAQRPTKNHHVMTKTGEDLTTQAARDSLMAMSAWYKGPRTNTSQFTDTTHASK
jgi:hypothetical protein